MIDGEPDGETVESEPPLCPSVLLHHSHDDCTFLLFVIFVNVMQLDPVLRVVRERVCGEIRAVSVKWTRKEILSENVKLIREFKKRK